MCGIGTNVKATKICSFPGCKETDNLKHCTGCKAAYYCKDHQRQDWKSHKVYCKAARAEKEAKKKAKKVKKAEGDGKPTGKPTIPWTPSSLDLSKTQIIASNASASWRDETYYKASCLLSPYRNTYNLQNGWYRVHDIANLPFKDIKP